MYKRMQELEDQLFLPNQGLKNFKPWWTENGEEWISELRQFMINYRNIGHNWQFTNEQKEKLDLYHEANQLLVECLNSDCNVSLEVRQKIENTLLLPLLHPDNQT